MTNYNSSERQWNELPLNLHILQNTVFLYWNFTGKYLFIPEPITFKNGEAKWMGDLGYAVQRKPVLSIKIAVLNFVKEGIHPIQTHWAGWRSKQRQEFKINIVTILLQRGAIKKDNYYNSDQFLKIMQILYHWHLANSISPLSEMKKVEWRIVTILLGAWL